MTSISIFCKITIFITCILIMYLFIFRNNKSVQFYSNITDNDEFFTSKFDHNGRTLYLTSDDDKTDEIKNLMIDISDSVDSIIDYCKNNEYPSKERSTKICERWKRVKFKEILPNDSHIAYLVDKDRILRLCFRKNFTTGEIENRNTMMFVILHELGHLMSESYGHNAEFRNNFLELIRVAGFLKLYTPIHYSDSPTTYCGTEIYTSPCEYDRCNIE